MEADVLLPTTLNLSRLDHRHPENATIQSLDTHSGTALYTVAMKWFETITDAAVSERTKLLDLPSPASHGVPPHSSSTCDHYGPCAGRALQ